MADFFDVNNAEPDTWVQVANGVVVETEMIGSLFTSCSDNIRYWITDEINNEIGPRLAGQTTEVRNGWTVRAEVKSSAALGGQVSAWLKITEVPPPSIIHLDARNYDVELTATVYTRSGEIHPSMDVRPVDVRLLNPDGTGVKGAKVIITHSGLNQVLSGGVPGAVSHGSYERITDNHGTARFDLIPNTRGVSGSHYIIKSIHPITKKAIHDNLPFVLTDSGESKVDNLIAAFASQ